MSRTSTTYAALVLPDVVGLDCEPILKVAADLLARETAPEPVAGAVDRAIGTHHTITVHAEEKGDFGPTINLAVYASGGAPALDDDAIDLLTALVVEALRLTDCDIIEWCHPSTLMERDEFLEMNGINPALVPMASDAFVPTELHELRALLTERSEQAAPPPFAGVSPILLRTGRPTPEQSRLGAASWLMTSTLSIVSMPVGAALSVYGLIRGMEFRMATQALSVTSLFVALGQSGALKDVVLTVIH